MYTLKSDLRTVPDYSAAELDAFLANCPLHGSGGDFVAAGQKYGINPVFVMCLGILESAWGRSNFAQTRNNLFGYQAYDSNPDMAARFSSFAGCIHFISQFIANSYLRPREVGHYYTLLNGTVGEIGRWWGGAPTLEGVFKVGDLAATSGKYATSPTEAQSICNLMNQFLNFAGAPVGAILASNDQAAPATGTYTVVSGDNLWTIAERLLGSGSRYADIVAYNHLSSTTIHPGQQLAIPGSTKVQTQTVSSPTTRTHVVAPGENLWTIAQQYYGNGSQYGKIANANRGLIKQDNLIQPGWNLIIPS